MKPFRMVLKRTGWILGLGLFFLSSPLFAVVGPENVLLLVNENSRTSRYIARMYRHYHPEIMDEQILLLGGLADSDAPGSTPASEILSRTQFEQYIAGPVRDYLTDPLYPERIAQIRVIITTAGFPYRIEDTHSAYANAIYPAGSDGTIVAANECSLDAATVESELCGILYNDSGGQDGFGIANRMVNPYQGYRRSGVDSFDRLGPGNKDMIWSAAYSTIPSVCAPLMEGESYGYGTRNRSFHAGDMLFTARLDGPKIRPNTTYPYGINAIFAVRAMLERAKRASDPEYGVNPLEAAAVLDRGGSNLDRNRTFNLENGRDYWQYQIGVNQPPDACLAVRVVSDYKSAYWQMTQQAYTDNLLNIALMPNANNLPVFLDLRTAKRTSQADLNLYAAAHPERNPQQGIILLASYGVNGDEANPSNYLLAGGSGGGPLFQLVNGAVFTSFESYNAVTMYSDEPTRPVAQGKLVDFIAMGGTAAIGHAFEPQSDAAIDNEFLFYNLLADEDADGKADMTFIEAAYSAIPYLSWSEVVLGDPLMRIAYGPGGKAWLPTNGDADGSGDINIFDCFPLVDAWLTGLYHGTDTDFEWYDDLCDFNRSGLINTSDLFILKTVLYDY